MSKTNFKSTFKQVISSSENAQAENNNTTSQNIISITGKATQSVSPNLIRVAIRVDNMEKDLNKSYSNNTQTMTEVNKFLMQSGVQEKNITTRNYQVVPIFRTLFNTQNSTWNQVFVGYRVVNEIEIILSNLKNLPEFVDKLVGIGNVYVTFIQLFYSEDLMKNVENKLLEDSALNAFDKAAVLAKALRSEISHVKFVAVKELNFPKIGDFAYSFTLGDGSPLFLPRIVYADSNAVMTVNVNFVIKNKIS